MQELSNDPKGGFLWWLKTHKQKLAFDQALEELLQEARKKNFQLDRVTQVFSQFIIKKDDAGQVQWYQDAHDQLINCEQQLQAASFLKPNMVKSALTKLRFISEADQFHEYFKLQPLQRRVRDMYESITERLDVLLKITKNKTLEHKTELDVREQEAKLQLAVELSRQTEAQLKQEEAALKKIETERDLIDHQRDAEEEAWKRDSEERKLRLEETQQKHQMELQNSFGDLQLEIDGEHPQPAQANNSAEQLISVLLNQIKNGQLDRSKPEVKEQLQALLSAIAGL